jgi:two-component system sensor histidine kinase AtoS
MISKSPQNSRRTFRGQQNLRLKNFESLLELVPHAALLLDSLSQRILIVNSKIAQLSLYTRSELTGLDIGQLILDWNEEPIEYPDECHTELADLPPTDPSKFKTMTRRNRSQIDVQVYRASPSIDGQHTLLVVEPINPALGILERTDLDQLWQGLKMLADAAQEDDLERALHLALKAGNFMTGAEILSVYQAEQNNPILKRCAAWASDNLLPEQLSVQNLLHLKRPTLWTTGKHPGCELHRAARSARFSYLASAPIGQTNALVGLVIIADRSLNPNAHLIQIAQLLGATITSILQNHLRLCELQSELQKRESHLRLNSILEEHLLEGIILIDANLNILRMNLAAEMIFGYTDDEVAGQPVEKILIGTDLLPTALDAAKDGSATLNLGDIHIYRRNGEAFQALVRVFPIHDPGPVDQILVLIQDLSEQEQIRLHAQQLEQHAILGEVTAIFAHEVRNPINNISTGLQLMAMNLSESDANQESISRMLQDCDRLAELLKSVLSFSRPTEYEMENLDISLLLERLLQRLGPRIRDLNIACDLKVETDYPRVRGNLRALEQVFSNLITNALQAMRSTGGNLILKVQTVHSPEGRSYVEISVADNGPGIPKEIQERIFQPFFTTEQNGTGLGLAISKRIITAHKGNIRLNSFPGGTIFHVQIPIAPTP